MKRNRMLCVILSAFIVLSFLGLQRPQDRSSAPKAAEVTVERKLEGNLEWYIYVNQEGEPIQPSDRDYAILVNTYCRGPRKMRIECPVDNSVSHE